MEVNSPQLEDGFTRIANELLDAIISFELGKREQKIILFVIRKTYGYGKKKDDMTLTQIANATGLDLAHVSKSVKELYNKNILLKQQGKYGFILGINKDYGQWNTLLKQQPLAETAITPCQNSNLTLPKQPTQKKLSKENTKIKNSFSLPDWVPPVEWKAFIEHRRVLRKPLTEHGMNLAVGTLKKIVEAGHNPEVVINETILKGWQSFYLPKAFQINHGDIMDGVT